MYLVCSDENLTRAGDQHEVQGQHLQSHLTLLRSPVHAAQERIEQTLEHREVCLDLPTLAVQFFRPVLVDELAVKPGAMVLLGLARAAALRRDHADDAQRLVEKTVVMLAVEAGVRRQRFEGMTGTRLTRDAVEFGIVRTGTDAREHRQAHVPRRRHHRPKLGKTPLFPAAAAGEVIRDTACFHAGGVAGRQQGLLIVVTLMEQTCCPRLLHAHVEQLGDRPFFSKRFSAWISVLKSGTSASSSTSRSSAHSLRRATVPR